MFLYIYVKFLRAYSKFKDEKDVIKQLESLGAYLEVYFRLGQYSHQKELFLEFNKTTLLLGIPQTAYLVWILKSCGYKIPDSSVIPKYLEVELSTGVA